MANYKWGTPGVPRSNEPRYFIYICIACNEIFTTIEKRPVESCPYCGGLITRTETYLNEN